MHEEVIFELLIFLEVSRVSNPYDLLTTHLQKKMGVNHIVLDLGILGESLFLRESMERRPSKVLSHYNVTLTTLRVHQFQVNFCKEGLIQVSHSSYIESSKHFKMIDFVPTY